MATIENVKTPAVGTEGGRNWFQAGRDFLVEVRNEMKRVTWPSSREVYATTLVVILVSAFFGLYLFVLDLGMSSFVNWIFAKFGGA
ncbi:MAG: preprotein translocase subunit SecE [Vicinamibacterales bacterium]